MKWETLTMPFTRHLWNFSGYFFIVCILLLIGFIYWMEQEYGLISYMWELLREFKAKA